MKKLKLFFKWIKNKFTKNSVESIKEESKTSVNAIPNPDGKPKKGPQ